MIRTFLSATAALLALCACVGVAWAEDLPQLDAGKPTVCMLGPDGGTMRVQCDEDDKRCLAASAHLDQDEQAHPVVARMLEECLTAEPGAWERLVADGYTMVPARNESPWGYARDERGRLFQTHFDLRRRYFLGVSDVFSLDLSSSDAVEQRNSVWFEARGSYEKFDSYDERRNRFRFLEVGVRLDPLTVEGLVFQWDRGRTARHPSLWITTFIGEPRRFDLNMHIGPGLLMGRVRFDELDDRMMGLVDIGQLHVNWEAFQSGDLEDYFLLRFGGGVGIRFFVDSTDTWFYVYPEAALEWAWLAGERGLTQIKLDATGRLANEPITSKTWYHARGALSIERIVLAITDQPISLFVEPSINVFSIPDDDALKLDFRAIAGGRISFFVPPRDPPACSTQDVEEGRCRG